MNIIVEHSDEVDGFDTKPYLSTSKILRALIYLDMMQHWGDVPFITKELSMDNRVSRTNKDEVMNALLKDINESIPYLYEDPVHNQTIVSQDLANALVGLIHLEQKDYNGAASYFSKIIDETYTISFENSIYSDINNKEAVFTFLSHKKIMTKQI